MADDQDRLREALHDAAATTDAPTIDWRARLDALRARRRRSRRAATAGVLAVSALVAGVVLARSGDERVVRTATPTSEATAPPTPAPSEVTDALPPATSPGRDVAPGWHELAAPPIPIRTGIVTAWTGTAYLAIGLGGDSPESAAYDPAADRWRPIAAAPLAPRRDAVAVWTGSKLIVWGGTSAGDDATPRDDGARYDPVADEWYAMASLPGGGRRASATVAAWDGEELLVWGGGAPGDGAAYDPVTDTWRTLPAAPIEWRDAPAGVWTGSELLVWGGSRVVDGVFGNLADGAAYSPATDTWRSLPPAPMQAAVVDAAWTGMQAVFTPGYSGDPTGIPLAHDTGGVYDPSTDSWTAAGWLGQHPGTHLVAANGGILSIAKGHSAVLDPTTGTATELGGDDIDDGIDPATVMWTGSQALGLTTDGHGLIGVGFGNPPAPVCEATATPDDPLTVTTQASTDRDWTVTPVTLSPRTGAATAWTGSLYVVWGGTDGTTVFADGVVVDPATGTVRAVSPAPIDGRTGALAVWTGEEVIVAGGSTGPELSEPLTSQPAAAYDPAADTWRLIPRSDVQLDLLSGPAEPVVAWTGSGFSALTDNGGAAFDATSGRWLALPRLPQGSTVLGAWWDGRQLNAAVTTPAGGAAIYAFEPGERPPSDDHIMDNAAGDWREVSSSPTAIAATVAGWVGDEVVIVGGGDPVGASWGSAAFDPGTGEWRELAATPYHPGAELVWTGTEALLAIKGGYGVLDVVTGELAEATVPLALIAGSGEGTGDGAVFLGDMTSDGCDIRLAVARYRP